MEQSVADDELCDLFKGKLKIFQKRQGYRFSVDSILLAAFAQPRATGIVVDLGTGSGILPIMLAKTPTVKEIIGIEVQEDLARMAQKNVVFNHCQEQVTILQADIRNITKTFTAGSCDTVISNPPFYPARSGRINPNRQKAISRHELYGTLSDFLRIARHLLKVSGKFLAIYPSIRVVDLIGEMRACGIEPKILQFIYPRRGEPANLLLVEGVKGAGREAKVLAPLILYNSSGAYTVQAQQIFSAL